MMKDNMYLLSIAQKKRGNMDIYNSVIESICGKKLSWSEVQDLDDNTLIEIMLGLDNAIKISQSPIDIKKLARAIQHSRSGIGGSAMTKYTCLFCGSEDIWINTAVPNICLKCATKMAENIVRYQKDIMKQY